MADILNLICLVEGNRHICYIRVPYISNGKPATVDTLRNLVFEDDCKDLTSYYMNLTVFKVSQDTNRCSISVLMTLRLMQALTGLTAARSPFTYFDSM